MRANGGAALEACGVIPAWSGTDPSFGALAIGGAGAGAARSGTAAAGKTIGSTV